MSTFGVMQTRIADELARSDLSASIRDAIRSAIAFHERRRFYFNEASGTFTTVASQAEYTSADASWIPNVAEIDDVRITISNDSFQINKRSLQEINFLASSSTLTGDPTDYCYSRQRFVLYPTPQDAKTIRVNYVARFTTLSDTADTNAWMTDGEELIRLRAKMLLFRDVIRDPAEMATLAPFEAEALRALTRETGQRNATGFVVATAF